MTSRKFLTAQRAPGMSLIKVEGGPYHGEAILFSNEAPSTTMVFTAKGMTGFYSAEAVPARWVPTTTAFNTANPRSNTK